MLFYRCCSRVGRCPSIVDQSKEFPEPLRKLQACSRFDFHFEIIARIISFVLASFSVRYPFRSTSSVSNTSSSCSGSNSSIWPLLKHRSMSRLVMNPFPSWSHVLNRASQSKMSILYSLSPYKWPVVN